MTPPTTTNPMWAAGYNIPITALLATKGDQGPCSPQHMLPMIDGIK